MFILIVVYFAIYYIRPAEWIPGLIGMPLFLAVWVISLVVIGAGIISKKFPQALSGEIERVVLGFLAAIILSQLSHLYVGATFRSLISFLPALTGFFLIVCILDSRKRLTAFILLLIGLTTFLAYEGCIQHFTGFNHGGLEPYFENKMVDGEIEKAYRIRWYGVFNDPNDLGLALVLVIPFLLDSVLKKRFLVPFISLPIIASAIYFTNSRGTILAGIVAIGSYFIIRYRSLFSMVAGILLGGILFLLGPSRMAMVSSTEESAYGRVDAWYQAYQMFKDNPFFGVGQGMFTDFHNLTAHNSFVLVMAELGILGLFFFTALFYFPYHWLWRNLFKVSDISLSPEDIGSVSAAFASLTSVLISMFFISRSYILLPFMSVAYVSVLTRIIGLDYAKTVSIPDKSRHIYIIIGLTILQIVLINIMVKTLI